jgi:hypothetical protein
MVGEGGWEDLPEGLGLKGGDGSKPPKSSGKPRAPKPRWCGVMAGCGFFRNKIFNIQKEVLS